MQQVVGRERLIPAGMEPNLARGESEFALCGRQYRNNLCHRPAMASNDDLLALANLVENLGELGFSVKCAVYDGRHATIITSYSGQNKGSRETIVKVFSPQNTPAGHLTHA